jgi:hypothetical protein
MATSRALSDHMSIRHRELNMHEVVIALLPTVHAPAILPGGSLSLNAVRDDGWWKCRGGNVEQVGNRIMDGSESLQMALRLEAFIVIPIADLADQSSPYYCYMRTVFDTWLNLALLQRGRTDACR